jgi:sugar phosphate permease
MLIQVSATGAILAPPAIAPVLLRQMGIDSAGIGAYIALAYIVAAISSVYAAAFIQRWGSIRTSQAALGCCAIGLLLIASQDPFLAAAGAIALGMGYGPITPASSEILARTTPADRYALVFSLKQTGVPLGGAVAGLAAAPLAAHLGTSSSLVFMAILCVLAAMLGQSLRRQLDDNRDPTAPWPTRAGFMMPIHMVLSHAGLRVLALCSLVFSAVQMCLSSYLVTYLNASLRWTLVAAGAGLAVAQSGGVVGRILWGAVADMTGKTMATLRALGAAMAASSILMVMLRPSTSPALVLTLVCVFGCTAIGWNGVYLAAVARQAPRGTAGTATAGCLFFTYIGVVVSAPLFGVFSTALGNMGVGFALLAVPLGVMVFATRTLRV